MSPELISAYKNELRAILGLSESYGKRPLVSDKVLGETLRMPSNAVNFTRETLIHSPLTEKEKVSIETMMDFEFVENGLEGWLKKRQRTRRAFPGRESNDILTAIAIGSGEGGNIRSPSLIVAHPLRNPTKPFPFPTTNQKPMIRNLSKLDYIKFREMALRPPRLQAGNFFPTFVCSESSGPITSLTVNKGNSINGVKCIVGACAQVNQAYNRPGELILLDFEEQNILCRILDGHSQRDRAGELMRSTVTATAYDGSDYNFFLSAGYDGQISFWNSDKVEKVHSESTGLAPLNCLTTCDGHPIVASGSQEGILHLIRYNFTDQSPSLLLTSKPLAKKAGQEWTNSVDGMCFGGGDTNKLYSIVGFDRESLGGKLFEFDLDSRSPTVIFTSKTGISTIDIHPSSNLVGIGTGGILDGSIGSGEFFLLDPRQNIPIATVMSGQMDMDTLKFSQCGNHVVISETSDNSVMVYDTRLFAKGLLTFNHFSSESSDGMMGLCWLNDGRLVSGGMDGKVKIHDLNQLSEPLQDLTIGHHINCITHSIDDSTIFIGTDFGTIHCLSQNPAISLGFANKYKSFY